MKKLQLVLVAILATSCMNEFKNNDVDFELQQHFNAYIVEAEKRSVDWNPQNAEYKIEFESNLKVDGVIVRGAAKRLRKGKYIHIRINKEVYKNDKAILEGIWSPLNEYTMIHECAHAFLNMGHNDIENHIMNPTTNKGLYLNKHRKSNMLDQLFENH